MTPRMDLEIAVFNCHINNAYDSRARVHEA